MIVIHQPAAFNKSQYRVDKQLNIMITVTKIMESAQSFFVLKQFLGQIRTHFIQPTQFLLSLIFT